MDKKLHRILAVIDPTQPDQWALNSAISIARLGDGIEVVACAVVHSNARTDVLENLIAAETHRHRLWLEHLITSMGIDDITLTPLVIWDQDWREAIAVLAKHSGADLIIKRGTGRPGVLGNSDRRIVKTSDCSVLLINHEPAQETKNLLVALKLNAKDDAHQQLNELLIHTARQIKGRDSSATLHAINAYWEPDEYVEPSILAKRVGIPPDQAHVSQGTTSKVIAECANNCEADLVIIGTVGRKGLSGLAMGNTAERVLASLHSNVLIVTQEGSLETEKEAA